MTLEQIQHMLWSQIDAALVTVDECIRACPESHWNVNVGTLKFSQVCFHTLFFADLYLSRTENLDALKAQRFHQEHREDFKDYEEAEDRKQANVYSRAFIEAYLLHCRAKAREIIFAETAETLSGASGFSWRKCNRGELHIYNTRHIQHHAAQLSLRLRLDVNANVPWVSHGKR
jgi:hypothetical protein